MGSFHLIAPWEAPPCDPGFDVDPKLIAEAMATILKRDSVNLDDRMACRAHLRNTAGFSIKVLDRHLARAIRICRNTPHPHDGRCSR